MVIGKNTVIIILFIGIVTGTGSWLFLYDELLATRNEIRAVSQKLQESRLQVLETKSENNSLLAEFELLEEKLQKEQRKFDELEEQVEDSLDAVALIRKATAVDEELLQKYSKVSFLNEHYIPKKLSTIDKEWRFYPNRTTQIHSDVWPFLEEMLEDAKDDDVELLVLSAYRSFGTQAAIKERYIQTFGTTAANTFSADQGFSEHQLGSALDFTTSVVGGNLSSFGETASFQWLQDNAYKYGFILSYPKDNQYYIYEPWHWRFVGKELAKDLRREDIGFYDLDQRTINEYRAAFFDD